VTRSKKLAGGLLVATLALAGCRPEGTFDEATVLEDGSVRVVGTSNENGNTSRGTPMLFVVDKTLQIVVQPQARTCAYFCLPANNVIRDEWDLAPGNHDICATSLNEDKEIPADLVATPIEIDENDTWVGCRDIVVPGPSVPTTTTTTVPSTTTTTTSTTTSTTSTTTSTTTTTVFDPGPPPPEPEPPFEP